MSVNFPTSLDNGTTLPNPVASSPPNNPSHAGLHDNENSAIIAVQTKLGTGASTPTNGNLLIGTGVGSSAWTKAAPAGTIVGTTDSQDLSNKTATTMAIDTITGKSVSTVSTIANLGISNGVITSTGYASSTALQANAVQANQLATSAITLGYAQITGNFTTTSTSFVQVTGLAVTVTIPSGGRRIKVTVYASSVSENGAQKVTLSLWNGTVGSGTQLQSAQVDIYTSTAEQPVSMIFSNVPAAGSITYNVGMKVTSGTGSLTAGATNPAFILVEAI